MTEGEIEYVRASDGVHIAHQTRGAGQLHWFEIGGFGSLFPLDAADEQPRWHRFEERLRRFCRLTKFDLRGIGYSDQFSADLTVDQLVSDAIAVMDAAGIERGVVSASGFAGPLAIELAARAPERVDRLVLANTAARTSLDDDYRPIPTERPEARGWRAAVDPGSAESTEQSDIDFLAPSLADDADVRRWWTRAARRGASPAVAAAYWDLALGFDVRATLPTLRVPTLVVVSTGGRFIDPEFTYWMAERIPGADVIAIPATDHLVWAAPDDVVVNELERRVTGTLAAGGRRTIAAVMFTDIVDSTAHNAARGDRAWRELLARHDDLAEREITLRGGRVVKRLGDGLLAVFPLVSDALDAATAIADDSSGLGIGIRAGLHVAEIEEAGADVLGLGVTIAARVMAEASGGEVLTTRAAADLLAGSKRGFEPRGRHRLKGVDGDWELLAAR